MKLGNFSEKLHKRPSLKDVVEGPPPLPPLPIFKGITDYKPTPNVSRGREIIPEGIVLHHTGGSYSGAVAWCLNPRSQVSYHVIVNLDGKRTILASDNQRAWHSGVSSFKGKSGCNNFMLGISVSGDTNHRELTKEEIESVALLCVDKMKLWGFGLDDITTHKEVSPGRKNDVDIRAEESIKRQIKKYIHEHDWRKKSEDNV